MKSRILFFFFGFLLLLVAISLMGCGDKGQPSKILVFSKTAGFRHASIVAGQEMFFELGQANGFQVDTSEDASLFHLTNLKQYTAIVFLNTTGNILNEAQQLALQQFMQTGGGWLGIHAAADTEYDWSWYNELVGAYFNGHPGNPNVRQGDLHVLVPDHPATSHLNRVWTRFDEWYNYRDIKDFTTLIRIDEDSYEGGTNGDFHPMTWCRPFENGHMFYTGLGHTAATYAEPEFRQLIIGALQYVMKKEEAEQRAK
ncbi:MAG: ThuA domain-containing protein [Bacteroidota bacterium]